MIKIFISHDETRLTPSLVIELDIGMVLWLILLILRLLLWLLLVGRVLWVIVLN
jgi:uncharacterized protein with PQ loop repeat